MQPSDNPEQESQILAEKLESVVAHRRRPALLSSAQQPAAPIPALTEDANHELVSVDRSQGMKTGNERTLIALIRRIPLVGPALAWPYYRVRQICAPNLHWKQRVLLIPMLGSAIAWSYGLVRLTANRRHIMQDLAALRQNHLELQQRQLELQQSYLNINNRLDRFDAMHIANRLNRLDGLDIANRLQIFDLINIANRLNRLDEIAARNQARDMERDNRIAGLTQEMRRSSQIAPGNKVANEAATPDAPLAKQTPSANDMALDRFYVEFEDLFRGSRADIRERLKVYLPYFAALAGDAEARVVDIGCGRGEWLELMVEQGISAIGIDLNRAMVDACREQKLGAECTDAIEYLRQQPEGSLAAVTGFHIIEHLPFETLLALFDAALLALRPDGFIIFETPNPENYSVGAFSFYHDPTHRNPIVPAVAEFMARQRGFARAEIVRLHPYPDGQLLTEDSETARRLNQALYGPQDYAVVAWKVHAN